MSKDAQFLTKTVDISPKAAEALTFRLATHYAYPFTSAQETMNRAAVMIHALRAELTDQENRYRSAVETLVDIAAMGNKAGSESAKHRLRELGIEWATGDLSPKYGSMT